MITQKERQQRKASKLIDRIFEVKQEIKSLNKVPHQNKVNLQRVEYWQKILKNLQRNTGLLALSVNLTQ